MFKRISQLVLLVLSALFVLSSAQSEVVDRVVAVVGNDIITLSDLRAYQSQRGPVERIPGEKKKTPIEGLIREKLLEQEMAQLNLNASEEEINNALKDIAARNNMSVDVLKSEMTRQGVSLEQYKKTLSNQIRQMKFMGQVIYPRIKISDEEIARKAGKNPSDESRMRAKLEIMQSRAPEELSRFVDELRSKTYVEIKESKK